MVEKILNTKKCGCKEIQGYLFIELRECDKHKSIRRRRMFEKYSKLKQ